MLNRHPLLSATIVALGLSLAAAAPAAAAGHHGGGGHGGGGSHGGGGHGGGGHGGGGHGGGGHGGGHKVFVGGSHHGPRYGYGGTRAFGVRRPGGYFVGRGYPVVEGGFGAGCRTSRTVAFLPSGFRRITTTRVCIVR